MSKRRYVNECRKTEKTFNLKYRKIECSKMTEEDISATSSLFSDNYGIWSMDNPNVRQQAKEIFLVAHKADWIQRKLYSLIKMPRAWK